MKNDDKVVSNVYESFDYDKFKILPENRGQKESKGINERKLKNMQRMIDAGTWIHEISRVRVNVGFEIVDGAHTLEICRRNGLPIRYEISHDPHFNETTKRELIGNVYLINSVTTSWSSSELFAAAIQTRAPLALVFNDIIQENDNVFLWTDLMGLLTRDSGYFIGRWRKTTMKTFEDKKLVDEANDHAFQAEIKSFAKLNAKARIAPKKGFLLQAAYDILWHVREMINPSLFRKSLASVPDTLAQSQRTTTVDGCRRLLIQHYNKSQGQNVEMAGIMYALRHKDAAEPVLEIA
jgi:hypothetical protein